MLISFFGPTVLVLAESHRCHQSNPHGFELGPRVEGPGQDGLGDGREGVVHGEVSVCDRAGG